MEPRLALHLIATYEYPSCSDMAPASMAEVKTEITTEELVASKGFGYICLLMHGVEGLTGVEFALRGIQDVEGFKGGRIEWCAQSPLQMGDFEDRGGIVAFPCESRVAGEEFIVVGYLPFEYKGSETIHLTLAPSSYSKPNGPMCYMLDCTTQFAEHEVVEMTGATIEGAAKPVADSRRALRESSLLWSIDSRGQLDVNHLAGKDERVPGSGAAFPIPWVVVDGTIAAVRSDGEPVTVMGEVGTRWVVPPGKRNRVLRFQRDRGGETRSMAPWDLEVLDAFGRPVFKQPQAGHKGWISPDGSRVAWQETAHAGRMEVPFRLWQEKRGVVDGPPLGIRDGGFFQGGRLVGRGVAMEDVATDARKGDWGVFGVDSPGRLGWWQSVPKAKTEAFAVSESGIVLAQGQPGGDMALQRWTPDGESVFAVSAGIGLAGSGSGGRMVSAVSRDGSRVAVAWAPRRGADSYSLSVFDGRSGQTLWSREVAADFDEANMAPDRLVFSGDGTRLGLLSFRPGNPPASGVTLYDADGTLIWRRKTVNCLGMTRDLQINESGDVVLFVACSRAYLYHIHSSE
jgi:hypothetical protein